MTAPRTGGSKRQNPLGPLVGFILLLVVGGFSALAAPLVVGWLQTAELTFGLLGWKVLPIQFPASWPPIAAHVLVGLVIFVVVFTILMIVLFSLMKPPREEMNVELSTVRARKGQRKRR